MIRTATALLPVLVLGCADPGGLLVTVEGPGVGVPDQIDALELRLVASQTPATDNRAVTCRAVSRTWSAESVPPLELPLTLLVRPGDAPWRCLAVRAIGLRGGDEVVRAEDLYCPNLESAHEATLILQMACHQDSSPPECDAGQACRASEGGAGCVVSNVGSMFDAAPTIDQSCDVEPE